LHRFSLGMIIAVALASPAWAGTADTAADASAAAEASADAGAVSGQVITVTATRNPTEVEDVPVTVTVIDAERIADELATDIKDLVRFEPGVSVRRAPARFGAALGSTGRDGNAGFNIRGLEGNRVLIQVDGVRVPDGFSFGAQAAGRDYVDVGLVKSVEILRGPASALYGSDGLAGAVSFVTSDPADFLKEGDGLGGLVRGAYSSADDEFAETAIVAGRSGEWSALVAYTRRDGHELENKGTNDAPNSTRTAPNPQDTRSNAVLGKIVWSPDDSNRIRLTVEHLDDRVETNVLSGVAPVPSSPTSVLALEARDTTKRNRAGLDWRYEGSGTIDSALVALWYQDGKSRQFTAEDRNTAADRTRINSFENRVFGASAELHSDFKTGEVSHRLVYGGDVSFTRQKGLRDGTVPPVGESFPTRAFPATDFTLAGLYIADEIAIADGRVTIFPALRFDHYDLEPKDDPLLPTFDGAAQDGSRLSPKIGAVAKIGGGVSAFANYARGFKAPAPSQVNQFFENPIQNYTSIPNPDLKPETSRSIEGGLRLKGEQISASVTGFSGRYRNFIEQVQVSGSFTPTDPGVFQVVNLDRARIEGVEGRIDGRTASGFTGSLAIAYAHGDVIDEAGERSPLQSIDPLKLVAGIGWRHPLDRFGGQIILTHSARKSDGRAGTCADTFGGEVPCFRPDSFTILDATAFVRVAEAFTLRAGLFNLLDEKYAWWSDVRGLPSTSTVTDAYTQPGRNVSVSLTASF